MTRRADRHARLRALTRAAYTATAGHLEVDPEDDPASPVRRWSLSVRAAVGAAAVVLVVAVALALRAWSATPAEPVPLPLPGTSPPSATVSPAGEAGAIEREPGVAPVEGGTASPTAGAAPGAPATVVVHVAGAVAAPGVVELPAGSRVADAVAAAGGAAGDAEVAAVNLARVLADGEQVYLPRVGESPPGAAADGPAGAGGGAPGGAVGSPGPVNLNTAGLAELDALPGVGPVLAERIVAWRDANGPFLSVEDLDAVSGIGPAMMERLRDLVRT